MSGGLGKLQRQFERWVAIGLGGGIGRNKEHFK